MKDTEIDRWVTWRGRHIPIAKDGKVLKKIPETKEEEFNNNFYMKDGDFYEEWRKAQPEQNWETKYPWGEENIINVYDKKNNKKVGYLKYKNVKDFSKTSMTDKINVVRIHVEEDYRRKGIGTQLYKELQRRAGDTDINFGEFSDEGKKLVENIGIITKKEKDSEGYYHYWGRIKL